MKVLAVYSGCWVAWAWVFYLYRIEGSEIVTRVLNWLLRGSVLELLVAVPAHVVVRHRGDCTAPAFTAFGVITGLAIMLLCFGPGVLALYKKKLDAYSCRRESRVERQR